MKVHKLEKQACELLREACCPHGILASPDIQDNYRRIWSRDAVIAGMAGLLIEDETIVDAFRSSIRTLATYQHHRGMIPSNVLPGEPNPEISYGGLAGRVDATTWFIVGSCLYLLNTGDEELKDELHPHLRLALKLLEYWEFNGNGLVYTPLGGNWADEYPVSGHTLYDNLLRVWGLSLFGKLYDDKESLSLADHLKDLISVNFWPTNENTDHPDIYHRRAFKQMVERNFAHFACSVDPAGYNLHFDAAAHGLIMLLGWPTGEQFEAVTEFTLKTFDTLGRNLVPAFWPVITEQDPLWAALKENYSYSFKNTPHHFHNGGIWPVWMGLYGLGMHRMGKTDAAEMFLEAWMHIEDPNDISFSEYITSDTFERSGKQRLCFSASGMVFLISAMKDTYRSKLYLEND